MKREQLSQLLLCIALLITIGGAIGAYRFFRTVPELQSPQDGALWQLVPYAVILLVILSLLLKRSSSDKDIMP